MSWEGVLALTLVVRDEEDILAANLDFHLAQGVDVILVIDHGSSDGTPEILREYESGGQVRVFREEDRAHDQAARVERLLRIAAHEHGAEWVIHCDADEFWMPTAGSLRDVFGAVPDRFGYMVVARSNFIAAPDDSWGPFYERLRIRESVSRNLRGDPLEPKVAQRPAAGARVQPGNHGLINPVLDAAPDIAAVEVLHYPRRSYAQFERKVLGTGIGYELLRGRESGVGIDQLALLERQRAGELPALYVAQIPDPDTVREGLSSGALVIDERLAGVLSGRTVPARESFEVQRLLRSIWERWIEVAENARALEARTQRFEAERAERDRVQADLAARLRSQEAELARLKRECAELSATVDIIRNSATMRVTAPARRVYYKLRRDFRLGPGRG